MASHTDMLDEGIDVEVDVTNHQDLLALHTSHSSAALGCCADSRSSRADLSSERPSTRHLFWFAGLVSISVDGWCDDVDVVGMEEEQEEEEEKEGKEKEKEKESGRRRWK